MLLIVKIWVERKVMVKMTLIQEEILHSILKWTKVCPPSITVPRLCGRRSLCGHTLLERREGTKYSNRSCIIITLFSWLLHGQVVYSLIAVLITDTWNAFSHTKQHGNTGFKNVNYTELQKSNHKLVSMFILLAIYDYNVVLRPLP